MYVDIGSERLKPFHEKGMKLVFLGCSKTVLFQLILCILEKIMFTLKKRLPTKCRMERFTTSSLLHSFCHPPATVKEFHSSFLTNRQCAQSSFYLQISFSISDGSKGDPCFLFWCSKLLGTFTHTWIVKKIPFFIVTNSSESHSRLLYSDH